MFKGFRDFLLRGNIVDLAVAVVIGTAFTALVASFADNLINPLIAAAGGGGDVAGLGFSVRDDTEELAEATFLDVGAFLSAILTFLITAAIVYFLVVVPMKRMLEHFRSPQDAAAEAVDEQTVLLREIRDALVAAGATTGGGEHVAPAPDPQP